MTGRRANLAKGESVVRRVLLDWLGSLLLIPAIAAVFWPLVDRGRLLTILALLSGVTVLFSGLAVRAALSSKRQQEPHSEIGSQCVDLVFVALPWVLAPTSPTGRMALVLLAVALSAGHAFFYSTRRHNMWNLTSLAMIVSAIAYQLSQRDWVGGAVIAMFALHFIGGWRDVRDLANGLSSEQRYSELLARTDALTGLGNRRALNTALDTALDTEPIAGHTRPMTMICIDIDNFKQVNDRFGQRGGDQLLTEFARFLERTLGPDWLIVRAAGDEFLALVDGDRGDCAQHLLGPPALAVADALSAEITVSAGVTVDTQIEDLVADASAALRIAKSQGKRQVVEMTEALRLQVRRERSIAGRLNDAIANGEITLWAQPIVDLNDKTVHSYECLARWIEADGTTIPPSVFIGLVEDRQLTRVFGEHIITMATDFAAALPIGSRVAVNISPSHFVDPSFVSFVRSALERQGVPPEVLTIEVTETESIVEDEAWPATAVRLRNLGVGLSIDDFGTGYSSIDRLVTLPLTQVKLDRTMIASSNKLSTKLLVRGLAHFARSADVELVAEGIESATDAERILSLDVPLAQGYHFARPAPVEEVLQRARDAHSDEASPDDAALNEFIRQIAASEPGSMN